MNAKKFHDFMRALGLGDEETWTGVLEEGGGVDRVIDKALQEVGAWWIKDGENGCIKRCVTLV